MIDDKLNVIQQKEKIATIFLLTITFITAGFVIEIPTAKAAIPPNGSNSIGTNVTQTPEARYSKNLVVDLTLFGINKTAGQVFAFVNDHGIIQTANINSTKLDMQDNKTDGIGHYTFYLQNITLTPGDQFTTCAVIPSSLKMICATDYKVPYVRGQEVDISLK